MPSDYNHKRSQASKRRYSDEDDDDFGKRKRTEKNDTGTKKCDTGTVKDSVKDPKCSGASTSGAGRSTSNEPSKNGALGRLQQLRDRIKKDVFKMGPKDAPNKSQSSGGNSKTPQGTKPVCTKQDSNSTRYKTKSSDNISKNVKSESENIPKKIHSGPRSSNEVIIILNSSSESEGNKNSPRKMHSQGNITGKHVPESKRKSRSLEILPEQKKKTTSQSPMNQRMSRIRKQSIDSNSLKTKILNVSEKILSGDIKNIVNSTLGSKNFKKIQTHTQVSDIAKATSTSGDSKAKLERSDETAKENPTIIALPYTKEINIFATNNNDKGSPNKMHGLTEPPTLKPISTPQNNIFASGKINDIKSPEFNFESERSSSPKEYVQSKNTNILATDNNNKNNNFNLSLEAVSPCAIKTPNNHNSSTETVIQKSTPLADRLKKIRGQLENAEKEANKSTDNQISIDELYKNPQPSCSRSAVVESWIESTHPTPNLTDQSVSDSMVVNFDNTLFEKSELLADSREDNSMEWDSIPDVPPKRFPGDSSSFEENQKEKAICVVADTNIFMNDLDRVEAILNLKLPGDKKLIIYVPWMVLGELDNLKEARSNIFKTFATQKALKGQKFINKHLAQTNSRIVCQSVNEVCQQLDLGKSPDDKILACCLQVQNKYETVILLTGDINLRNKALANQVKSYPPFEIVERLENSKFFKIKALSQEVLSDVICKSCWNVYGEAVHHMRALQNGRWNFEDCLARFKQYWQPVFSQMLLKHCLKTIDELVKLARKGKEIETNPKEFKNFVDRLKELLFYLQDIDYFNSIVKKLRDDIDAIVRAPSEF